jgi:cytochrome d ubiquinol oxidase subunit II
VRCILRGISIEFRSHVDDALWRGFLDAVFAVASRCSRCSSAPRSAICCAACRSTRRLVRAAAVHRLDAAPPVGTLDWYTVLVAVFATLALAGHGASFLVWKCDGAVADARAPARARRVDRGRDPLARRHLGDGAT